MEVCKIVMISSSNADGADASYARASDLSVVALLKTGERNLALLRLGGSQDPNWDWDTTSFCYSDFIVDIETYKGQLCALDYRGRAFLMDYNSLEMTQVAAALFTDPELLGSWMHLVESCGDLYLDVRSEEVEPVVDVKVYKLSFRLRKWLEVDNVGNRVFLQELNEMTSIPRDMIPGKYGCCQPYCCPPSLIVAHHHNMDSVDERGYCFLDLTARHCIPWLNSAPSASTMNMTTTSSTLSQYDNSIVGRTNYLDLVISHVRSRR